MNYKYIKRHLTLHDIGIPLDKYIEEYYNYVLNYCDWDNLIVENNTNEIHWYEGNTILFTYLKNIKIFNFHNINPNILDDFYSQFKLEYENSTLIINCMLSYILKYEIDEHELKVY